MKSKKQGNGGFTLIELLVVIAIIALLSSVALIAYQEARQKSRDAKRLSDMTQMANAMELYFTYNRGYPDTATGTPVDMTPTFLLSTPSAPLPADGACDGAFHPVDGDDPVPGTVDVNTYYYAPSGTPYALNGKTLYKDYVYYFCLGRKTGNFDPGIHMITPRGIK